MTWRTVPLGDLLTLQRGHDLTEAQRCEGAIPVVGSAGIHGYHNTVRCKGPGVTVGRSGASIGVVTWVGSDYWPHNTVLYVTDFKGNDPAFMAAVLRSVNLAGLNSGSAQPSLNRNFVYPVKVTVPTLPVQRRIAGILSAYDNLIENNTRRIAILEDMARRLYEEWFLNSDQTDEWAPGTLGDWVTELRDAVDPNTIDPDTPYIGLEHLPRRSTTMSEWGKAGSVGSTKLRFQRGDVLFGKIRPYFHKVAVAPQAGVSSSDAIVMRPLSNEHLPAVLAVTSSDDFVAHATQTSNGTKMPRANWTVLKDYPLPRPPHSVLERFNALVEPSIWLCASLAEQNAVLRGARDLLLPKLISGEIDVSRAGAADLSDLAIAAE